MIVALSADRIARASRSTGHGQRKPRASTVTLM
jgi:hypothetical protein